jgi:hypothetical protein
LWVIGVIGVEGLARDDAPTVHNLIVGDVIDAGIAGDVVLPLVMRLNLAKELHSGLELVRPEMLAAYHQYVMLDKGALEDGAGFGIDRLRKVDADDFGTDVIGQGRDGERRHRVSLWRRVAGFEHTTQGDRRGGCRDSGRTLR